MLGNTKLRAKSNVFTGLRTAFSTVGKTDVDNEVPRRNGKRPVFDVFLCHNSADAPVVSKIGSALRSEGLIPWIASEQLRPGVQWQRELGKAVTRIRAVAVLVGKNGRGPWQDLEIEEFLREFVRRRCPVIPVILAGTTVRPKLPVFLAGFTWVDFRHADPDPIEQLVWGITGTRKERR